jgi:hypothetical protein
MKWTLLGVAAALVAMAATAPVPAQGTFPFGHEMLLEAKRLPDARRVPMLEIQSNGRAMVDLWCHNAVAEVTVNGNEIKFNFVSARPENCTPERAERDDAMGRAMAEITHWSRKNDIVIFTGPSATYRFRLSTH